MKTTYNAASAAFKNFAKGFNKEAKLSSIRDTVKVFKKIQDELVSFEKALQIKVDEFNKYAEGKKKEHTLLTRNILNIEVEEMSNNFELNLTDEEKALISSVLDKVKLDGTEDSITLVGIEQFIEDLS